MHLSASGGATLVTRSRKTAAVFGIAALVLSACANSGGADPAGPADPMDAPPPQNMLTLESNVAEGNLYPYTVTEYVNFVVQELDQYWTQWFIANGYSEPFVELALVNDSDPIFRSDCRDLDGAGTLVVGPNYPNAFYCAVDGDDMTWNGTLLADDQGALILPIYTMQKIWIGRLGDRQAKVVGDFAAAIVVAHEFGHHVQNEWARQYNLMQEQAGGQLIAEPNSKYKELMADCLAGVWANSVWRQGLLEAGDLEEAISLLEAIGDQGTSTMPHGTGAERRAALEAGMDSGAPTICSQQYWLLDMTRDFVVPPPAGRPYGD
jgi:predicted metalloprotease